MNQDPNEKFIEEVFGSDPPDHLISDDEVKNRYQHLVDHLVEKAQEVWTPKTTGVIKLSKDWIINLWDSMTIIDLPPDKIRAATRGSTAKDPETDIPGSIMSIQVEGDQCVCLLELRTIREKSLDLQASLQDVQGNFICPFLVTVIQDQEKVLLENQENPDHGVILKGLEKADYTITLSDTEGERSVTIPLTRTKS